MKLVIVGGVAAGMSAAARARRLDEKADIIVLERGAYVSFANCGLPYHISGVIEERDALLLQTPQSLKQMLNLDVRVLSEVVVIDRAARRVTVKEVASGRQYEESYDHLVLAPGAMAMRLPLPGADHSAVMELRTIDDMDAIIARVKTGAKRAVVMGGFIGIEAAENLKARGLDVTLVEKMSQIMGPLDPEMAQFVKEHLELSGIHVWTQAGVVGFKPAGSSVVVQIEDGRELEADLVVLALGSAPNADLAKAAGLTVGPRGGIQVNDRMQTSDPDIYAAGDAVEVVEFVSGQSVCIPMAGPANRQGRIVADNIFGRDSRYRGTQGSALMKVFDMTMGVTGPNEKFLKKSGVPYRRIYLNPNGHAGYYPGTSAMHFKLLFSPDGMKIFGAQIVGFDGVDKRIDVVATAMRGNLSVFDLEHLELGYAPPYSSAKDPVNMAGFIASNLQRGDLELWYGDEFPEKSPATVILDVRTPAEFEAWHIPQAVNLPVQELRKRIGELDKSRAYDVYCKVGFRSYLAYRILKQNGFCARTLAGGTEIFRAFHPELVSSAPPVRGGTCGCAAPPSGVSDPAMVRLDCSGMQCPGPIRRVSESLAGMAEGAILEVTTTDQGFAKDISAWCAMKGHELLSIKSQGAGVVCCIRKGGQNPAGVAISEGKDMKRKTMVVFSGELDKVLAAFVIANGAVTMGDQITMFFTFWGLNALRKSGPQASGKGFIDRMFGWMMPKGSGALKLSNMNMMGMGTALMKYVMKTKNVESLEFMMEQARQSGVKIVACSMSMDVMGLKREELVDGVEIGGVATFLAESDGAGMTLFI